MYFVIYKITNKINNKIYIGQTTNSVESRWRSHCCFKKNKTAISMAIKKYGKNNFDIEIIDGATNQAELNYKEFILIHINNSLAPNGYNLKKGGHQGGKWGREMREKMFLAGFFEPREPWNKNKKMPPPSLETRMARSRAMKGRKPWNTGIKMTLNQKLKTSNANKKRIKERGAHKNSLIAIKEAAQKKQKAIVCQISGVRFYSVSEAAIAIGTSTSNICKNLKGKISFVKGFDFCYEGETKKLTVKKNKGKKTLYRYKDNIILGDKKLCYFLNINYNSIYNLKRDKQKFNKFLNDNNLEIVG